MGKVIALHGSSPSGWNRERWAWMKSVWADARLLPMPRLVGTVLASGFANSETAECTPGLSTLMAAVGASKSTILRALADLQEAGWLERRGGNGPGRKATYAFRRPEQVSPVRPEQVSPVRPEQVSPVTRTGVMEEKPPCTPHKDKPNMNHNARVNSEDRTPRQKLRGLPRPGCLTVLVQVGSEREARWNAWLAENGFPGLDRIGRLVDHGLIRQWEMPLSIPSRPQDVVLTAIARGWADWLRSIA